MTWCDHCGDRTDLPSECWECGGQFCGDHEQPLFHDCSGLEAETESTACQRCGTTTESLQECSGCGEAFCSDHARQIVHGCSDLERTASASSSEPLSEIDPDDGGTILGRRLFGG